jgi:hypothetical protein
MKSLKQHITEAKAMSKETAIEVLKILQYSKPYQGAITFNKAMRNTLKDNLPDGTKFTRDVPGPTSTNSATFAELVTIASGGKDSFYFDDGDWVKNDKTLVKGGMNRKDFKTLIKAAGLKL